NRKGRYDAPIRSSQEVRDTKADNCRPPQGWVARRESRPPANQKRMEGEAMSRVEFSRKVKAAIIKRAGGKCEKCNAALKAGEGEVDHILPCALGGEATVANGRLLCRVCHKAKTHTD